MEACPLVFELHSSSEAALTRHINLREQSVGEGAVVGRSALQRVFEITVTKKELEKTKGKLSIYKLAQYYATNVRFAQSSETVTKSFIECAYPVFTSMLSDPVTVNLLRKGSDDWGTAAPLNYVYKMQLIVTKSAAKVKIP